MTFEKLDKIAGYIMFGALIALCAYTIGVREKGSLNLDNIHYEITGVMELHDNGNTLYTPVFKRKTPQ